MQSTFTADRGVMVPFARIEFLAYSINERRLNILGSHLDTSFRQKYTVFNRQPSVGHRSIVATVDIDRVSLS